MISHTPPVLRLTHCLLNGAAVCLIGLLATVLSGCGSDSSHISFREVDESQPVEVSDLHDLELVTESGDRFSLSDYRGKKNVVLVITRGWINGICIYCSAQTARWMKRYQELEPYDAELVVVFPVKSQEQSKHLAEMREKVQREARQRGTDIPYPLLLDVELKAVDQLGIRADLAKPATYVIDKEGRVRFAYVGQSMADRPSIDSILRQLKQF